MTYQFNKAVVIGAGTMGAALAGHLANASIPVTLLDIVPRQLTPEEEASGLTLEDRVVRNRIVNTGLQAAIKSRPASFFSKGLVELVQVGNLEDDFDVIEDADLVLRPPQEDPAHLFALILGAVRAVLIDPIFCRLLQLLEKRINPLLGPCRLERRQTHGFLG